MLLNFIKNQIQEISPLKNIRSLKRNVRGDILSGITVAIIALPLALAFGEISKLGPIAGIWGAIAGGIFGGLFGGCLVGVSGPTAPKAAQIASFMGFFIVGTSNQPDLVAAFSIIFLSGLILVAISFLRVSRFIHFTPYPVVAGFMCGIGVIVIITQINAFVGLMVSKDIHEVLANLNYTIQNINYEALYVSIPSLSILFLWPLLGKKINLLLKIPAPLIALIIGTCTAHLMELDIPYIGDKMGDSSGMNIFTLYIPDLSRTLDFISPAFALAVLAVLDSLLSCKVADNITGRRHSSDRETFGQGMANMAAGLMGGVTTATATMRTVANIKFGGETPLASIVHGMVLLAILSGLGFIVAAIPNACLAAILFKVGIDILDYRILPVLKKIPILDLIVFIVVLFVTVYEDLMIAIGIGIAISMIGHAKHFKSVFKSKLIHEIVPISETEFYSSDQDLENLGGLKISVLIPKGPIFFGSVEGLLGSYANASKHQILIIDMNEVEIMDLTGIYALEDLIKSLIPKNIDVYISNLDNHLTTDFERVGVIDSIGRDKFKREKKSVLPTILNKII